MHQAAPLDRELEVGDGRSREVQHRPSSSPRLSYHLPVNLDRRGFLRLATAAAAGLLGKRSAAADPAATPLEIHRATRNTRAGALGDRLRAYRPTRSAFKPFVGRPRVTLPRPAWATGRALFEVAADDGSEAAFAGQDCSLVELARLLFLANGITEARSKPPLRAAPSAGALYAGEVYVAVERVSGLAPGLYSYSVGGHQLVALSEAAGLEQVALALENPSAAEGAAFAVLLSNVFGRYAIRYANRGYRYALIDSGHIGENLRLAAAELGLRESAEGRFEDDRLNALLDVDGREEAVCAVHLVGRPGREATPTPGPRRRLEERQQQEPAALAPGLPEPVRYHEATKLVAADTAGGRTRRGAAPATAPRASGSAAARTARPRPGPGAAGRASDTPVHAAIRIRRSARRFEPAPLARADLMQILAIAQAASSTRRSGEIELHSVVHRVLELAPGLYAWDPAGQSLEPRRPGELAGPLVRACLGQRKTGQAAAAVVAVAKLDEASARGGARSYRQLLLEAGATAQRIYLAAEALGLAARNLAAYYDDELDALLGLDGARRVAVHLTAVGPGD